LIVVEAGLVCEAAPSWMRESSTVCAPNAAALSGVTGVRASA
jgi:hypothetical protein